MKRLVFAVVCVLVATSLGGERLGAQTSAAPTISSLSSSTLARSGRLLVAGTGFGAVQGASTLSIDGRTAFVTRWSDTLVVGYVPETTAVGAVGVQVVVDGAGSNVMSLSVTTRQSSGRVKWRFQVDAQYGYLYDRPAVGPDGMVVAIDAMGNIYALSASGGLKWIVRAGGFGPPSIGADGTTYVASMNTITAIAPDGAIKWTYTEPSSGQGVIAGPTVGPDGNIYVVTDFGGLGAFALSPAGGLLWSNSGNPTFMEYGQLGAEIAFGQGRLYVGFDEFGVADGTIFGLTLGGAQQWAVPAGGVDNGGMQGQTQPAVGADGSVYMTSWGMNGSTLYAFDPGTGALKWTSSPWPSNGMSEPTVGADGTIFVGRSLSYLDAIRPNGTTKWSIFDGGVLAHPTVDLQGAQVLSGEAPNYGEPGFVRDFSAADGHLLWQVALPSENGGYQVLESRPRFTPDGQSAYFGTFVSAPDSPDQYAYLYAVDTSGAQGPPPPPPPPTGVTLKSLAVVPSQVRGGAFATGTVTLTGAAPTGGAVVKLTSSRPTVASVPPSVTVRAGTTSATFRVTTSRVFMNTTATISGAYAGVTKTSSLTVTR
jgi:IPT/TIG domain